MNALNLPTMQFKCLKHDTILQGEPELHPINETHYQFDLSEQWCSVGETDPATDNRWCDYKVVIVI